MLSGTASGGEGGKKQHRTNKKKQRTIVGTARGRTARERQGDGVGGRQWAKLARRMDAETEVRAVESSTALHFRDVRCN